MNTEQANRDIASIREIMEKSTKFVSLSGMSGVLAGIYSLSGALFANWILQSPHLAPEGSGISLIKSSGFLYLLLVAGTVILLTLITVITQSRKKAARKGQKIWNTLSKRVIINLGLPLATGGIIILYSVANGYYDLIASLFLIFYGLSLINASHLTVRDVRYLGISQLMLGIICLFVPGYGLWFWAAGFGILHIVYGMSMYYKYDRD